MPDNLVLRTVYVDPDMDEQLRVEAASRGISKAELFRRYLSLGMKSSKKRQGQSAGTSEAIEGPPLVLRTVYMDPKIDDRLRVEAFDTRTSKNDLMRRYVRVGMRLEGAAVGGP